MGGKASLYLYTEGGGVVGRANSLNANGLAVNQCYTYNINILATSKEQEGRKPNQPQKKTPNTPAKVWVVTSRV